MRHRSGRLLGTTCSVLCWLLCLGCNRGEAVSLSPLLPAVQTTPQSESAPAGAAPIAPYNVVLVTVDTLRADIVGYAGGAARTPRLDALAKKSWLFRGCISASMLTNPSHISIMTSLYPRDHGVYTNDAGVQDDVPTLAKTLSQAGYHTGAVINFAHLNPGVANLGGGFAKVVPAAASERHASQTTAVALDLIDSLRGAPFFTWLHYSDPHAPYDPPAGQNIPVVVPPRHIAMAHARAVAPRFQRDNAWFQDAFRTYPMVDDLIARYTAEVEATDAALGSLIDGLAARQLLSKTVLVITADHGENLGDHDLFFHHGGLYDATVHVPLLVSVPGAPPRDLPDLVQSVDIAPTILELAHQQPWPMSRGTSLLAYAQGAAAPRDFAFSEHMLGQMVAIRSHEGSLIVHRRTSDQFPSYAMQRGRQEVYDLIHDPGETTPVRTPSPLATSLHAGLRKFTSPASLALQPRPGRDVDRDGLRALGYTQ